MNPKRKSELKMSVNNPVQRSGSDVYESEEDYVSMAELDEENINWGKLCCRVFSIFLLLGIICLAAVGSINDQLYYLAIFVAIATVCVFSMSFMDLELLKSRTVHVFRGSPEEESTGGSSRL